MRNIDRFSKSFHQLDNKTLCRFCEVEVEKLSPLEHELLERLNGFCLIEGIENPEDFEVNKDALHVYNWAENYGFNCEEDFCNAIDNQEFIEVFATKIRCLKIMIDALKRTHLRDKNYYVNTLNELIELFDEKITQQSGLNINQLIDFDKIRLGEEYKAPRISNYRKVFI